jgi:hypothetical protein
MRKAKIVLSVIVVLAVIGGLLAFRANRFQAMIYYSCNSIWFTCQKTWTIGGFETTIYDPVATLTVSHAATDPGASGLNCAQACTYSNNVYIEPGF